MRGRDELLMILSSLKTAYRGAFQESLSKETLESVIDERIREESVKFLKDRLDFIPVAELFDLRGLLNGEGSEKESTQNSQGSSGRKSAGGSSEVGSDEAAVSSKGSLNQGAKSLPSELLVRENIPGNGNPPNGVREPASKLGETEVRVGAKGPNRNKKKGG